MKSFIILFLILLASTNALAQSDTYNQKVKAGETLLFSGEYAQAAKSYSTASLTLLEDRVLIGKGKKQVYGSQVTREKETGEVHFCAIEDVDHVDQRRASMGLGPLAEYARHFGIVWDAEAMEKNRAWEPRL